ncbi:iron-containing redox enzyme family protein [Sorangium sp. So ce260]|uniref:iron-containing redox enzyme family protein n=1 Tax=Sorangium sp. So ce260 TaxID=3133291 RepID=UPI003F60CB6B
MNLSAASPALQDLLRSDSPLLKECIQLYASNPLFRNAEPDELLIRDDPYRRPVRTDDLPYLDFSAPLRREDLTSYPALVAHRMLLNIYEADLLFLPRNNGSRDWQAFRAFYDDRSRVLGEIIRATLEDHVFGFLREEVETSGRWSAAALREYFLTLDEEAQRAEPSVTEAILRARDPRKAASFFLVQLASDYLSEASAMGRNLLGAYGASQSELFKILIDEYGYGVHGSKHSTLFEETMASVGLVPQVHAYWQFYLSTSLSLTNYFHYVSRHHAHFFKYLGALYYTEVTLAHACAHHARMLRAVFGEQVCTRYFDEHVHIDKHHGRMVFDKLLVPTLERYGATVVEDIVRGYEEFRALEEIAGRDIIAQIAWADRGDEYAATARRLVDEIAQGKHRWPRDSFVEYLGERSTTHVHDEHRLLVIESGQMKFWPAGGEPLILGPGDTTIIPRRRLHGSVILSERCVYHQPVVPHDVMAGLGLAV